MTWEGRIVFEVSSAEPEAEVPVWVDFSLRILDSLRSIRLQIGRQNDLGQAEPSRVELLLNNSDDALTFGNTSSPYSAWWGPGRKCRLRDTVNGALLTLFTGYLEVPEEVVITAGIEARVAISAVDRLGRLADSPRFVSTLTEYIRYSGGTALKAYWPLNDADGATTGASLVAGIGPMLQVVSYNDTPRQDQLLWAERDGPLGDDATYVQMAPTDAVVANNYIGSPRLVRRDFTVKPTAGDTYGTILWVYLALTPGGSLPGQLFVSHGNDFLPPTIQVGFDVNRNWVFSGQTLLSASWGLISPSTAKLDSWTCVAAFIEVNTNNLWLIVNGVVTTGVAGGGTGATDPLQEVALDGLLGQSFGHIQVYSGAFNPVTLYNAQYSAGLLGLERQPTGDRIRTIAQYVGLPNVDIANTIDPGQSVMQRAQLAGLTPLDAMREAETTEQGLLHTDADGRLVFKDRRTLYNI